MNRPDPLAEIRAIRDEMAARHNNDAASLARELIERSRQAGRVLVSFPPRPPAPPRAERSPTAAVAPDSILSAPVA